MRKLWVIGTKVSSMIDVYVNSQTYDDLLMHSKKNEIASNRTLVQRFEVYAYIGIIDFGQNINVIDGEYRFSEKDIYHGQYDDIYITSLIKNNDNIRNSFKILTYEEVYSILKKKLLINFKKDYYSFDLITYCFFESILYNNSNKEDKKFIEEYNSNSRGLSDWYLPKLSNDPDLVSYVKEKGTIKFNDELNPKKEIVQLTDYKRDDNFDIRIFLTVDSFSVRNIFETFNEKNILRIPYYQRNYVWTKELVYTLVSDIKNADVKKPKLLPAINCSVKTEGIGTEMYSAFNIVDGQQRITTLYLIFSAILQISEVKQISEQSYFNYSKSLSNLKFIRGSINEIIYCKIQDKVSFTLEEKRTINLANIYEYLLSIFNGFSEQEVIDFTSSLLNYTILPIIQDTISKEVELFDRLNSTSIPLTVFDKLKALLFSEYLNNNNNNEEIDEDKLSIDYDKKITNVMKSNNLTPNKVFKVLCRMLLIDGENENEMLDKYIKSTIKSYNNEIKLNDLNDIVSNLEKYISLYIYIYKGEKVNHNINYKYIDLLSDFTYIFSKREIYYPIIIKSYDLINKDNYNKLREYLFEIEKFEIKLKVIQNEGQSLTKVMDRVYNRSIYKDNIDIKHIKHILTEDDFTSYAYNCSKDLFITSLESPKKDSTLVNRLLYRIIFIDKNSSINIKINSLQQVMITSPSDEHILPQNFEGTSKNEEYIENIQLIGNRLLINSGDNSLLSNKCFEDKKPIYDSLAYLKNNPLYSNSRTDLDISSKSHFTISDVKARNKSIIDELIKIYW